MKQSPGLGAAALDGAGQPAQTQSMVHDLLDEKAERPQVQKRLAQEIASYRNMATTTCQGIMRDIGACYANTPCTRPSPSPSSEQCKRIPAYPRGQCEPFCLTATIKRKPGDVCYREDAECRAARARWAAEERQEKEDLERRREAWRSSYGPLQDACQKRSAEENAFAICQKKYDTTCNPKKIATLDSCVDEQVRTKGPTEQDARRLMQTEWDKRSKTGHSIRDSILD